MHFQKLRPFLLTILISSCVAPYSLSSLQPNAKQSFWVNGKEYISKETNDSYVEIAFLENNRHYFIFDVIYRNKSSDTVLIDPARFFIKTYKEAKNPIQKPALNPEFELLKIKRSIAVNDADQANQAISNLIESSIDLGEALTTPEENKDENYYAERNNARLERLEQQQHIASEHFGLQERKSFFEEYVLAKNSMLTNQSIQGQVYFPREPLESAIQIFLPIAEDTIVYTYRHSIIQH